MKRALFSILSFGIFIIEFFVNLVFLIGDVLNHIAFLFIQSWVRYHNRIQAWTNQKNYCIIEEVKNET